MSETTTQESKELIDKMLDTMSPGYTPSAASSAPPVDDTEAQKKAEDEQKVADELARLAEEEAKKTAQQAQNEEGTIEIEEPELANAFANLLVDQFNLELNDDFQVNNLEDVKNLIAEIIQHSAQPQFASDEVAKINQLVANGGNVVDYLNSVKEVVNWESFKLSDENSQKQVIREYYKSKGVADAKIDKMISNLVLDDELEKEAGELLPELQADAKVKAEAKIKASEANIQKQQEAAQKWFEDSTKAMDSMKEFQGVQLSDNDRKRAISYLFGVDKQTGKTYEQLDYEKDPIQFRLELALLRTKKDLQKSLENKAKTEATRKFQTKLRVANAKDTKKGSGGDDREVSVGDLLSKYVS